MKMFHFMNRSYGNSYTIMAESLLIARNLLFERLDEDRDDAIRSIKRIYANSDQKEPEVCHNAIDRITNEFRHMTDFDSFFDIKEYDQNEILVTEND